MDNMDTGNLGIMAGIIISLGFFAMLFGAFYLYRRERMAMIERGMNPRIDLPKPHTNLRWGLLLIGAGLGLFLAYLLDRTVFTRSEDENVALYFALIAIFGGLGLFASYVMDMKYLSKREDKE
jgi:O-antigen/teichoic acid export membrane protein